jgi:uncharacterized protein YbbC (DUF1343 family)
MHTGLDLLLSDRLDMLRGARVGFVCNQTAITQDLDHGIDKLLAAGVKIHRLFGPEHGVRATAQDMIHVHDPVDPVTGIPCVSLYGATAESLKPTPEQLADLDIVLFDIQDIGARYYTYQATLGYVMQVAGQVDTKVVVLDRPNPINGDAVEGNVVRPGYESFVGAFPLTVRHGMTMGELARYFVKRCAVDCEIEVVPCGGWRRAQWFDQTGLVWVFPSPNMPTVDTATVYPGTCLVEGTNLSEGRGTTRPFHWIGAPWLNPQAFTEACREGAARAGLEGVGFRSHAFLPGFQKFKGENCGGVEIHVLERERLDSLLLGMVVIDAARRCDPTRFAWRTETYEYVDTPIAIDLLTGSDEYRKVVEAGGDLRALVDAWEADRLGFLDKRDDCLIYG